MPLEVWNAYPEYARIAIYDDILAVVKAENAKPDDGEEPDTDLLAGALRRSARRPKRRGRR